MSKRLTSLLVGALAVVLLGAPAQAQNTATKKAVYEQQQGAQLKKRAISAQQQQILRDQAAKAKDAKEFVNATSTKTDKHIPSGTMLGEGKMLPSNNSNKVRTSKPQPVKAPMKAEGEEIDEVSGIIVSPAEGEHKFYRRSGGAYSRTSSGISIGSQTGTVEIVECADGTIYIKDPVSVYATGAWVKGTKSGNTITVPAGQPVNYSATYATTLSARWGLVTATGSLSAEPTKTDAFTYTIEGDVISLQGTAGYDGANDVYFMGVFYDDDDYFVGGDYSSVYTYMPGYEPKSTTLVMPPAGLAAEEFYVYGNSYSSDGSYTPYKTKANIGFDGNDVYVQGLIDDFPTSWIKGKLEGNVVTFEQFQFLGVYGGSYNIWLIGLTYIEGATAEESGYEFDDFKMIYDAEAKTFTAINEAIANAAEDRIYYLSWLGELFFTTEAPSEPVAETGEPVNKLPYMNSFETEESQAEFGIIDFNDDGSTWSFSNGVARYHWNSSNDADDWLVSPAVYLEGGKEYTFSIDAWSQSLSYPERMEVKLGSAPMASAMTTEIIGSTDILWNSALTMTASILVPESGYYYVGIHAISDANQYYLNVDNFSIETPLTEFSPVAPRLIVQPDPYGVEKATITVVAPAKSLGGDYIDGLSKLNVYRDGALINSFENVEGGDTKVFLDKIGNGLHTYQAIPFDLEGNAGVKSEKTSVYVGIDAPTEVDAVKVTYMPGVIGMSWDPVTEGANGGKLNAGDVTYTIWTVGYEEFWGYLFPYLDELVTYTTENSLYLAADTESGDHRYDELAILPITDGGEAYETYFYVCQGEPLAMPIVEQFADNYLTYDWMTNWSDGVSAGFSKTSSDKDGSAIALIAENGDEFAEFTLDKVAISGSNPTLLLDLLSDGTKKNMLRVQVTDSYGETHNVDAFVVGDDFKTVKTSLAQFLDDDYVSIKLFFEFNVAGGFIFDNVRIVDMMEYDLATDLSAPASVKAGETATVSVSVKNIGSENASGYNVKLYADDEVLLDETVNEVLPSFATKVFDVDYETSIFDDSKTVALRAEVEFDYDLDEDNNVAEATLNVKQSTAAKPENVKGEKTENGVKITWNAPSKVTEEVTEDFEDVSVFEPFSVGGISATNHYGAFGNWTLYDGVGAQVYGFNGAEFPNQYAVSSWIVFNPEQVSSSFASSYAAASGEQYLLSMCPADETLGTPKSDHWLISPELPAIAQTISFNIRTLTDTYGDETYEILYSTTGKLVERLSFNLLQQKSTSATEWERETVELPAGTKYFAIRHTSEDVFGLMIDDVTYTRGGGRIVGYNIWVDGELAETTTSTSIELDGVSTNSVFAVSIVYSDGSESQPVIVVFSSSNQEPTAIRQITGNDKPVDIYTIDGKLVRSQATTLEGLKGAFIINGQKVLVK